MLTALLEGIAEVIAEMSQDGGDGSHSAGVSRHGEKAQRA